MDHKADISINGFFQQAELDEKIHFQGTVIPLILQLIRKEKQTVTLMDTHSNSRTNITQKSTSGSDALYGKRNYHWQKKSKKIMREEACLLQGFIFQSISVCNKCLCFLHTRSKERKEIDPLMDSTREIQSETWNEYQLWLSKFIGKQTHC